MPSADAAFAFWKGLLNQKPPQVPVGAIPLEMVRETISVATANGATARPGRLSGYRQGAELAESSAKHRQHSIESTAAERLRLPDAANDSRVQLPDCRQHPSDQGDVEDSVWL